MYKYRSQALIADYATILLVFLQAKGAHIFPDACHDTRARVFGRVEEVGKGGTQLETIGTLIAYQVDGHIHVLVALAFKFEHVKVCLGVGTTLLLCGWWWVC